MEYGTNYLSPEDISFSREGDSLLCTIENETHRDVIVRCAFPMRHPDQFISLKVSDRGELGMIRNLHDLAGKQRDVIVEELKKTYFVPIITRVLDVTEEFGAATWDVETDRGRCFIKLRRRGRENITETGQGGIVLTDVDSNRYEVRDPNTLDARSRSFLTRLI